MDLPEHSKAAGRKSAPAPAGMGPGSDGPPVPDPEDVRRCRSRAILYHALSVGFLPPGEEIRSFLAPESREALVSAAGHIGPEVRASVLALVQTGRSLPPMEEAYRRLFGHTVRSGVTPYETEYGVEGLLQQPHELSDLSGFAAAFGLQLSVERHERIDHVSCQCEFMGFLCFKEAHARASDDADTLEATRRAQRLFLKDHLGRFTPAFASRVAAAATGFYRDLARFCESFVAAECTGASVTIGSRTLPVRAHQPLDVEAACGPAEELAPMQIENAL